MKLPGVSVVITTYNRAYRIEKCLKALLNSNYEKFEIVVVNDGSKDNTKEVLEKYRDKITIIHHKENKGWSAGKNSGIRKAKYDLIALIDDDIIVERDWLYNLVSELCRNLENKVAAVTSVDVHAGHSICYLKDVMIKAGLFDERFTRNLRQDTDLAFRIQDLGYEIIYAKNAKFEHEHPPPKTLYQKIKFAKSRLLVHEMDVLLYKKHPKRTQEFLKIKFGFLRNPVEDFRMATGLWRTDRKMSLSSPEGVKMIENKTPLHILLIFLLGFSYVFLVKLVRLYGSLKFGKLLI